LQEIMEQRHLASGPDLGSLHVTIKKFYRASGETTESNGVAADIVLPSILNYANLSESSQPNFLPPDKVTSAEYTNFNMVKPWLPELLKRSLERRDQSKDFAYLQEDIAEYRKALDDKTLSMNEADRLAEQKAREARMAARRKEHAARPPSGEKTYDITVKNWNQPGLEETKIPKAKPSEDDDADPEEAAAAPEDPAVADPILTETRRIMADYMALLKTPLAAVKGTGAENRP
jgi:carboxyl-terminal processing protease